MPVWDVGSVNHLTPPELTNHIQQSLESDSNVVLRYSPIELAWYIFYSLFEPSSKFDFRSDTKQRYLLHFRFGQ
jgi:hypothetical protein